MSDRISQLIGQVSEKAILHRDQYASERLKNENLQAELDALKVAVSDCNAQIDELKAEVVSLEKVQTTTIKHDVIAPSETGVSDEQIDDLVKEIEYCIGQLKK
ncbi:MAG: putative amino acid dehydrogenase [Flavobacteriaceae bacterium]|jgi:predicted amino acid dehydrogenase